MIVARGHQVTPWELRPWERLPDRFSIACLETQSNMFEAGALALERIPVRTLRDRLPRGRLFDVVAGVARDRYLGLEHALIGADIVHAEELAYWFSADVARLRHRLGYRLVQTVWETLPMLDTYRNREARVNRRSVLEATDVFLPATERAREALLLEGVPEERIELCSPGIDVERFAKALRPQEGATEHVIVSPGRLVWEKGHHDVLRAVALLARDGLRPRVRMVGTGPEEGRLRRYAAELGLADRVDIGPVGYDEMPSVFASASCMVLASLPSAGAQLHPFDVPRVFWEEQFGMVLAEAMASGLDILAADSGAIPEVLQGQGALFSPGDWPTLARLLANGPLARAPGERVSYPDELVQRYSTAAMAERLAVAYDRVLSS